MLNRVTLHVYFILNLNGMLNRIVSCVDSFNYDWYAEFGMIMLDILFPFNLMFLEISRNSLVGDE